jgi:pimeloyl-ACP methyl ester carboxylesterase
MQSAFNHALVGGELEPHVNAGNLSVPVLLVHGSVDPIISIAAGYAAAAAIKRAQFLQLDDRGTNCLRGMCQQLRMPS